MSINSCTVSKYLPDKFFCPGCRIVRDTLFNLGYPARYHSCHHRLYVPYAFGALYNHPVEGFLLDTCGAILATGIPRLNHLQGSLFFVLTTIKTIDDHAGYSFPWDPLQHITPNRSVYHDIHHQNWGIKTNFSQPFLIVWDRWLGTMWEGGDTTEYYKKAAALAKAKVAEERNKNRINGDQKKANGIVNGKT